VTETFKDLLVECRTRREDKEKVEPEPSSILTKQQIMINIKQHKNKNEELKQEVVEYQVLDRHIKKENTHLKEHNRRL
jgi:FtsZ-binding cell division protein ZapB